MAAPDDLPQLPRALEERVLRILDGDEAVRDAELRAVFAEFPQHVHALQAWLRGAGVLDGPSKTTPSADGTAPEEPTTEPALPREVGRYRLVQLLGRGGFGTVYRAEQIAPIQRSVAVKVLNPGRNSREVLSRFAAEQQALNRMDHPGIARLLDSGSTPEGQPYFVMELVEGPTLAKFCRQRSLPLAARLQLFLQVLDAMQHAHQKAVMHRDLSSNNVLVADPDGRAQPKIIDFGIAKSLGDPLLESGAVTFEGTLMGTLEFMSPEQAAGRIDDLDTRADVYALGVQLYELLTDQLPIPAVVLRAQGLRGLAAVIETTAVQKASDVAPGERRKALRGDLDAITAKALAKARDDRYPSVAELAADLRRHLAFEPVAVATPTRWYRLRKFVRRHRAQSAAVLVGLVGLAAAFAMLVALLRGAEQAQEQIERERQVAQAKADESIGLLALEDALLAAITAAEALPPPWPKHEAALRSWLEQHGEPLAAKQPKLRARVAGLDQLQAASPDGVLADPADRHLQRALHRLEQNLHNFVAPGGPLPQVRERLRYLAERVEPALRRDANAWAEVQLAIQLSNGRTAHRDYHGLQLPQLPGLVPLGIHPRTLLAEFLDLASHPPDAPVPERGRDGRLALPDDCGAVLVLLPFGSVRLGAQRTGPGIKQYDPHAADDELLGQDVTIGPFLIACTEATTAQWARWRGSDAIGPLPNHPATSISWTEAHAVLPRFELDLPTEAQWEYACRAATWTPWFQGAREADARACGWFDATPTAVGRLPANGFGLFDTHGNVAEWCSDTYLKYRDTVALAGEGRREPTDPNSTDRVVRGGACHLGPFAARASARAKQPADYRDATTGIRPIRRLPRS